MGPKRKGIKRIVAVGDSITEGFASSNWGLKCYPSQLRQILHDNDIFDYEIINLGRCGYTMLKNGDAPYWND